MPLWSKYDVCATEFIANFYKLNVLKEEDQASISYGMFNTKGLSMRDCHMAWEYRSWYFKIILHILEHKCPFDSGHPNCGWSVVELKKERSKHSRLCVRLSIGCDMGLYLQFVYVKPPNHRGRKRGSRSTRGGYGVSGGGRGRGKSRSNPFKPGVDYQA